MHGFWEDDLAEQSHGEGFFTVLERMVSGPGLYLMDEPEAALSFQSCLRLVALMNRVAGEGGQVVCATHSPILASLRVRRSSNWARTAFTRQSGKASNWLTTGGVSSPSRIPTCGTPWTRTETETDGRQQPATPRRSGLAAQGNTRTDELGLGGRSWVRPR
ncbi:AAA family ATPase [Nonomuraea sp. NEAU-A123]|uniref:AAA family ATPase n=1 Tax=Nonomuraea sp. NEAU-A123 TaxID=2839649 RepID=UPI0035ABAAAB